MSFLERMERQTCYCGQERQKNNHIIRSRKQAMQEEVSVFFKERNTPLSEKDINVVQNDNFSRKRMKECVSETKARDLKEMRSPANLDQQRLDSTRRKDRPKSSICFTWSSSHRRSSITAVDLWPKTKGPDHFPDFPGRSVHSNLGEGPVRSVSTQIRNGEPDKSYFIENPLKAKGIKNNPERGSSPLIACSAVNTGWQRERLLDRTKATIMSRRKSDSVQNFNDDLSYQSAVRPSTESKMFISSNTRERPNSGLQEDDEIWRSSSPVERLLKECNNAFAQRPHEEVLMIPNIATKDHKWFSERTKESSFYDVCNVTPVYKPETKTLNSLHNQVFTT